MGHNVGTIEVPMILAGQSAELYQKFLNEYFGHADEHNEYLEKIRVRDEAYRKLKEGLKELKQSTANEQLSKNSTNAQYIRSEAKVGRNDKCTCGSGKKNKKCCNR